MQLKKLPTTNAFQYPLSQSSKEMAYCLIGLMFDQFKLYYYRPGNLPEEIPLQRPLLVAELLEEPQAERLPIAKDAFLSWFQGQDLASTSGTEPTITNTPTSLVTSSGAESAPWYNRWELWAGAGAIAGIVLLGIALNQGNTVEGQKHAGISIVIK
ncbi:MAG: hypothetical protein HY537_18220 [Deltaproteobacteria bacterium]|nr:hypothetical protein [Deltaproteobacteria bacterium]